MESKKNYRIRVDDLRENIKMIQTVYAITLVFGFKEIALSLYALFEISINGSQFDIYFLYHIVSLLLVAFVGFRFFWCLGNLTRYLSYHYRRSRHLFEWNQNKKNPKSFLLNVNARSFRVIVIINIIILFLHSLIFFFLTQILKVIEGNILDQSVFYRFIYFYLILLFTNSTWLFFLSRDKKYLFPEKFWCTNNSVTVFICISTLILFNGFLWYDYHMTIFIHIGNILVLLFIFLNSLQDILNTITGYVFGSNLTFPSNPERMKEADIIPIRFFWKVLKKALIR